MQTHLTVKGIVLREIVYGETDKLFDLLTENGICTVRARGVRKPGSKYAAVTQIFSYGEFCLRLSGERYFLDSAVSIHTFYGLRDDLESLSIASYFAELIQKTNSEQPQPQILRLFLLSLYYLSEHSRTPQLVKAIFELRFLTEHGMMPALVCCASCMQYEPEHPILRISHSDMLCADCHPVLQEEDMPVTVAVLRAARHVIFSEYEKLFLFQLKGTSLQQFGQYTERYLLEHLEFYPPALHFYESLHET